MKKFVLGVLALLASMTVCAKTSGISDVQPKGGFNLGINLLGVPPASNIDPNVDDARYCYEDAKMPMMGVDGNWTVASGMFNAGKFGQNGAIDLGFYYGICAYSNRDNEEWGGLQNVLHFRCAFHFEFVPKLDVYGGMFSGANIESPLGDDSKDYNWDTKVDYSMGPFIGAKYYFTDCFGLKSEFGFDWCDCGFPGASLGLAFKFK